MDHNSKQFFPGSHVMIYLLVAIAVYVFVWFSSPFFGNYNETNSSPSNFPGIGAKDELELALRKASMPNRTVIIAVINKAYVERSVNEEATMLDLFLESFWVGENTRPLLEHLLLVAVDQTAYERCQFRRLHCYRLVTEGVDFAGEKVYMSQDFINMMWRRTLFLLEILKRGYNFIFTDIDVMWLRNPFLRLSPLEEADLEISVDTFNDDPRPENKYINTGFYYIRSNSKTISLFHTWYSQKNNSTGKKEQDVLQDLIRGGLLQKLNLKVKFLETRYFSGFCQDSKDITAVTTMHANCCRNSKAKFRDLTTALRDWKQFKAAVFQHPEIIDRIGLDFKWTAHTECLNSWQ
ncbi:hypothetical protein E1A91_A12G106500v1 [Gossypium mustelinum]|uniref:Glycosyltransferase n=1 Tax=Gossypium mustelinum TaxID=34275 RepID=A0A5D2WSZ0_GOSMU|nr:hypothetical protein E1A91_A12G106500v1 [Gossypium mustelinum]